MVSSRAALLKTSAAPYHRRTSSKSRIDATQRPRAACHSDECRVCRVSCVVRVVRVVCHVWAYCSFGGGCLEGFAGGPDDVLVVRFEGGDVEEPSQEGFGHVAGGLDEPQAFATSQKKRPRFLCTCIHAHPRQYTPHDE
jgi:hypothetical protein